MSIYIDLVSTIMSTNTEEEKKEEKKEDTDSETNDHEDFIELPSKLPNPEIQMGMSYEQIAVQVRGYKWQGMYDEDNWDTNIFAKQIINTQGLQSWTKYFENTDSLAAELSASASLSGKTKSLNDNEDEEKNQKK
eukprot:107997_1